jgi:hypothetical protein
MDPKQKKKGSFLLYSFQILQNDKMINSNESSNDLERFSLDGRNQRDQQSKTCGC